MINAPNQIPINRAGITDRKINAMPIAITGGNSVIQPGSGLTLIPDVAADVAVDITVVRKSGVTTHTVNLLRLDFAVLRII